MRALHFLLAPLAAASVSISACAYNEALGRNQLLLVDEAALAQAGEQAWTEALRTGRVSRDSAANTQVQRVGQRIVQAAGLANRSWEYAVFEDDAANAFVMPGGKMGVTTGLLKLVQNDDQLAAVIGHEVGHIVASHPAERYSQTAAAQIVLSGAQGVAGNRGPEAAKAIASYGGIGAQLGVLLPFSRRHELEADRLGVQYMRQAGYRAEEAIALWRRMAAQGGGSTPAILSTHPSDSARIAALEELLRTQGGR